MATGCSTPAQEHPLKEAGPKLHLSPFLGPSCGPWPLRDLLKLPDQQRNQRRRRRSREKLGPGAAAVLCPPLLDLSSLQLGNSQLEYLPVVIPAHSCAMLSSHPFSFPTQTAWTPHSFPMTASPPSDSASFEIAGRAMLRGAKSFSLAQAELLSSPRCSSHLLCRALTSASCISPKSCCHSSLPDFCGEQLCAPCAGAPHVTKRVLWALPCLLPLQTALVRFFLQLLVVSRPHLCCLETGNIFCLRF